ncbi:MAG: glycosyltransferase family 4 protein [Chloroflexi bacterium]|nr:glycosyltransferase family 4 protein [Chloroflexota bacterium]
MTNHTPSICYVAYPTSLTLGSANAVQTYSTLRELRAQHAALQIIIPRMTKEVNPFDELGVTYIPRIGIGRLSRLYRSTLWYYLERSVFAWIVLIMLCWQKRQGQHTDIIFVREVICSYWFSKFAPSLIRAKVVYEIHHLEQTNHSRPKESWADSLVVTIDDVTVKQPSRIVSLTQTFKDLLVRQQWRTADCIDVLPDAYNDAIYQPQNQQDVRERLHIPPHITLICYAGLTFAYRRLDLLVSAFAALSEEVRNTSAIYFVGGRPQEIAELKAQCERLDIVEHVVFVGVVNQRTVAEYLAASDILAIPDTVTDETASPLKLFEYMAMQRAVVCPKMPALHEIVGDDGAFTFERGNQSDLTRALHTLISDPHLRQLFGMRASHIVAPHTYAARARALVSICTHAYQEAV